MSDTIEVNGITFTKEKPTKAGYYLTADVLPKVTWVHAVTVEPEYDDSTELGCWTMQWKPVSELDYYWHRLVPEQELAAVTKERDEANEKASRIGTAFAQFTSRVGASLDSAGIKEDELGNRVDAALARIKRLEEAGEWMAYARNEDDFNAAVKAWTQAKEAR
jgi:hypothetical protein